MVVVMSLRNLLTVLAAVAFASACTKENTGGASAGLEARVKKLEADSSKYKEMLEMIHQNFEQQKQQQQGEADSQAADDAVFAVDITGNQIEGPASGTYVTVIEAWDFA
jgi:hypothetical protein